MVGHGGAWRGRLSLAGWMDGCVYVKSKLQFTVEVEGALCRPARQHPRARKVPRQFIGGAYAV